MAQDRPHCSGQVHTGEPSPHLQTLPTLSVSVCAPAGLVTLTLFFQEAMISLHTGQNSPFVSEEGKILWREFLPYTGLILRP